ncbi:MAG: LysR family transcriptional regulator, partial [Burkholderiales bacterium]
MKKLSTVNLEMASWIARLGSFTAAAERLNTTQPAVSARVRELEETVGHKLFLRQGRGVELTVEGREFIRNAEAILGQLEQLSMSFTMAGASGIVRVGVSSICLDLLAAVTVEMGRQMPRVSCEVEIARAENLLQRLESRKLDMAILSGPLERHKFRSDSLGFDRMMWVTSPGTLARSSAEPYAQRLRGLPVWCVHRDSFYWKEATASLQAQGADPQRIHAIDNTLGASRMVAAGSGIGLLSEKLIETELAQGSLV